MREEFDVTIQNEESEVEKSRIAQGLDQLGELRAQREVLETERQAHIDQILTPEIKAQIEEIENEFANRLESINEGIAALEAEVKSNVIRYGSTVNGAYLQAVWNKGRVSWDIKSMEGYAVSHPEILVFRKEGTAFISIRKI